MTTVTRIQDIPPIRRSEVAGLAATENERVLDLLSSLTPADWSQPTDCELWDVRAMSGHVVGGMEAFTSVRELFRQMRAGGKAAGDGPFIDGLTSFQVAEHAGMSRDELLDRLREVGPKAARRRPRFPLPMRAMRMKESVGGVEEKWKMGYLLDVILTRDTWMHRVDISRATGREMVLTPEHDGHIVADVVAEWGRRHGRPFVLRLEGPAGGSYASGDGGEELSLDAVEFCRVLAERAPAEGLLAQPVPF